MGQPSSRCNVGFAAPRVCHKLASHRSSTFVCSCELALEVGHHTGVRRWASGDAKGSHELYIALHVVLRGRKGGNGS